MIRTFRSLFGLSKIENMGLSARKYLRSISESALHFKPARVREFNEEESIRDRVVHQFFDRESLQHRIQVFEAQDRLANVDSGSTPSHSFYQVVLPFRDNHTLRRKMIQFFDKYVRVGRVLELMDYIAANVAYRYCTGAGTNSKQIDELPFITVTAAVDEIDFFHPIMAELNCSFCGYVTYVGSSSMEVQITVTQEIDGKERMACSAKFVMAARDKNTGKAYKVPPIKIENEPEHFRIKSELGEKRQQTRKREAARGLKVSPPTYEESSEVHNLLVSLQQNRKDKNNFLSMGETVERNTQLMHLQDKNLSGKIFGGYIIRMAYELGWLSAYRFLGGKFPRCTQIDDIQFLGPVEIGSIVELESVISYIDGELMHVIVECRNAQAGGSTRLTNVLRVNFEHNTPEIRKVYPVTLKQSFQYIESMRRVQKYLSG